jgi:hypothetical protein
MVVITNGPGDSYDRVYDEKEKRDMRVDAIYDELHADNEVLSDHICDVLAFSWRHKNHPVCLELLRAFREGDFVKFGEVLTVATDNRLYESARDKEEDRSHAY